MTWNLLTRPDPAVQTNQASLYSEQYSQQLPHQFFERHHGE
jgi:hypothetical protein